jgi:hypothetical protein
MHLVKAHHCCPNFLAQPIRREEKFGQTQKMAIYDQKCKFSKRTNRQISLALYQPIKSTRLKNSDLHSVAGVHNEKYVFALKAKKELNGPARQGSYEIDKKRDTPRFNSTFGFYFIANHRCISRRKIQK